jgi:predicted DNA-binding transcriptional regulator AlpA
MVDNLYKVKAVAEKFAVTPSTIWYWVKHDKFPKPFKIGGSTFWKESELLAAQKKESEA